MIKRFFDFSTSLLGLLFLAPIFAVIAVTIRRDSDGPVFYAGDRIGREAKLFKILKFRTMDETPEAHNGPRITAQDDARITRLGRFLRDSKLNELPQLYNVLKGDMSLVGPRPEDPSIVQKYTEEQREVLSVRPGITSLATVLFADEEKMLNTSDVTKTYLRSILPEKLRLDLLYVRNKSFLLDLDILFRTMMILIPRFRGATLSTEDVIKGPVRWAGRILSWFTIDAAISFIAIGAAGLLWRITGPLHVGVGQSLLIAVVMSALFSATNWIMGVQRVQWRYASASEAVGVIISTALSTMLLFVVNLLMKPPHFPLEMVLVAGLIALTGFMGARYHRRLLSGLRQRWEAISTAAHAGRERVLVVGAGEAGQLTIWLLRNSPKGRAFHIIGVVDDDLEKLGTLVHRTPVLGLCNRIPEIVEAEDIGTIIFAIHTIDSERRNHILSLCWGTSARTVVVPDIFTFLSKGMKPEDPPIWMPTDQDHGKPDLGPGILEDQALKEQIHDLAEMARKGDFLRMSKALNRLDLELNYGSEPVPADQLAEEKAESVEDRS